MVLASCKKDEPLTPSIPKQGKFEVYMDGRDYSFSFARKTAASNEFKVFAQRSNQGTSDRWDIYTNKGDIMKVIVTSENGKKVSTNVKHNDKLLFQEYCDCEVIKEFVLSD